MNGNRKRSLLRIISLHGDRRKPPFCLGYRPFAFLKAPRHYNNDETAGNEMLRLLHYSLRNCCKSANKVCAGLCKRAMRRAKGKRFVRRPRCAVAADCRVPMVLLHCTSTRSSPMPLP